MRNFLKYDIKSNKKYILTICFIHIIFCFLLYASRFFEGMSKLYADSLFTDILLASSIIVFILENIIFIGLVFYKDYYKERAKLTFILPVKRMMIILSKLVSLSLFYILTAGFMLLSLGLSFFIISSNLIYYLIFALFICIMAGLITNFSMAKTRFTARFDLGFLLGIIVISLFLAYIISRAFSLVLLDNGIDFIPGMRLSFLYPFAIIDNSLVKIINPIFSYLIIDLILLITSTRYIDKNVNLL